VTGKSKICTVCGSTSLLQVESSAIAQPSAKDEEAAGLPFMQKAASRPCSFTQPDPFIGSMAQSPQIQAIEDACSRRQLSSLRRKFADCENIAEPSWDQRLADFGKHMLGR